jgi:hypothetical protein
MHFWLLLDTMLRGSKFGLADPGLLPLVERIPGANCVLKAVHVDTLAAELHPFHLQACSLFFRGFVTKFDLTAGAEHPVPWEMIWRIGAQ